MSVPTHLLLRWMVSLLAMTAALPAGAVILFGSGDPQRNTTAPDGLLDGSGWQWQTDAGTCATAVGPHHAATAQHLGLHAGSVLHFAGMTYPVVAVTNAPSSDFQLVELAGRLPDFAPLYTATDEVGRLLVVHGRGTLRGDPVLAPDGSGEVRGWRWGGGDGRLRWGTNVVVETGSGTPGQGFYGDVLVGTFGRDAGDDNGTLSTGDSGGGVFLRDDGGQWQLAAVNYAVESLFNSTTNGSGFSAALFDRTGFFELDNHHAWIIDDLQATQPETFFIATRVSSYADWVQQLVAQPVAGRPTLLSAESVDGPFAEHPAYVVDTGKRQITLRIPTGNRFFQLDGATNLNLTMPPGGQVVLHYQ